MRYDQLFQAWRREPTGWAFSQHAVSWSCNLLIETLCWKYLRLFYYVLFLDCQLHLVLGDWIFSQNLKVCFNSLRQKHLHQSRLLQTLHFVVAASWKLQLGLKPPLVMNQNIITPNVTCLLNFLCAMPLVGTQQSNSDISKSIDGLLKARELLC